MQDGIGCITLQYNENYESYRRIARDGVSWFTDVKSHPAFGDGIHVHNLVVGIGGEFISNADIGSQVQLDALFGGDFLEFAGKIQLVVFDQGSTHTHTTGLLSL